MKIFCVHIAIYTYNVQYWYVCALVSVYVYYSTSKGTELCSCRHGCIGFQPEPHTKHTKQRYLPTPTLVYFLLEFVTQVGSNYWAIFWMQCFPFQRASGTFLQYCLIVALMDVKHNRVLETPKCSRKSGFGPIALLRHNRVVCFFWDTLLRSFSVLITVTGGKLPIYRYCADIQDYLKCAGYWPASWNLIQTYHCLYWKHCIDTADSGPWE